MLHIKSSDRFCDKVVDNIIPEMEIGFNIIDSFYEDKKGESIHVIEKVDLIEISISNYAICSLMGSEGGS